MCLCLQCFFNVHTHVPGVFFITTLAERDSTLFLPEISQQLTSAIYGPKRLKMAEMVQ